jgi:hypothetical protein
MGADEEFNVLLHIVVVHATTGMARFLVALVQRKMFV